MSRFGLRFSTDDVFAELVEGFPDDKSFPLVLLSLPPVFCFFFGDPSFDADDDTRLGAIVNLDGDLRRKHSRNLDFIKDFLQLHNALRPGSSKAQNGQGPKH